MNSATLPDISHLIAQDPWLEPYSRSLTDRAWHYRQVREEIEAHGGLLGPVSQGHRYFGVVETPDGGQWYREWAPGATALSLIGDFNGWNRTGHPLTRDEWGVWSIFLPPGAGITHGSRYKVQVTSSIGTMDRIPAYVTRVVQEGDSGAPHFVPQYWHPTEPYRWQHRRPRRSGGLTIYEAHVGIAQEKHGVGSFVDFTRNVLPRIADLGYKAVQLMAIMEHPYYGSFGYHVANFFAVSSRFGTPDELKALIDAAHGMGLLVLMDLVHSHAVTNVLEGLNCLDGTEYQYFHAGPRRTHVAWDSLCFDYSKFEVRRFLLSNLRFWLEEYHFDGFRFDGVTSMLYHDHGLGKAFCSYDDYFSANVDGDAVTYLMLANELAHAVDPEVITIAEDVSGMVGLARPVMEGGLGFDYRLAMGIPDYWIKLIKEQRDEEWGLQELYGTLLNRRWHEKHVGYAESHDQALVGDKTIAFRLMDAEMYWNMSLSTESLVVARGVALHKMIRLITFSLGGEGYLNFMGNEFGHPEWIDFPREGNGNSYLYARRQWSLVDNPKLRYQGLARFDKAMLALDARYGLLGERLVEQLLVHEDTRQLVYRRGDLLFLFNFHPSESYADLRIPVPDRGDYTVVLSTDERSFGGTGEVERGVSYGIQDIPMYGRSQSIQVYLPARSAQVLALRWCA